MIFKRQCGRPLTFHERTCFEPYFPTSLLEKVRLVEEGVLQASGRLGKVPFWLSKRMHAVVLGYIVYFRQGTYQSHTRSGIALLAHELTHVQQFANGMTIWRYVWASRKGYLNNPYEVEAYAVGARFLNAF